MDEIGRFWEPGKRLEPWAHTVECNGCHAIWVEWKLKRECPGCGCRIGLEDVVWDGVGHPVVVGLRDRMAMVVFDEVEVLETGTISGVETLSALCGSSSDSDSGASSPIFGDGDRVVPVRRRGENLDAQGIGVK